MLAKRKPIFTAVRILVFFVSTFITLLSTGAGGRAFAEAAENARAQTSKRSSVEAFKYESERVVPGTVYHYQKSNRDGSKIEQITMYIVSADRFEMLNFRRGSTLVGFVKTRMSWKNFSPRYMESWRLSATNKPAMVGKFEFYDRGKGLLVGAPALDRGPEKIIIRHEPFHIYSFYFASLNFALRHLVNPESSFVIGVTNPTFQKDGPMFRYEGEVEITYLADETVHSTICRKYRIDGDGLKNRGGTLWVDREKGHIVRMAIEQPDAPVWDTFKLDLLGVETMDSSAWKDFIKKRLSSD